MSRKSSMQHQRQAFQLQNTAPDGLVVWVEPWAERIELEPGEKLDVVFVGPSGGFPQVLRAKNSLSLYGWEGSEFIALHDGCIAGARHSVEQIVRQEFDIAKDQVTRTNCPLPVDDIAQAQQMLDTEPQVSASSQQTACEVAGNLTFELADCFSKSQPAAELLWRIASRIVRERGLIAMTPSKRDLAKLWGSGPRYMTDLIVRHSDLTLKALEPQGSSKRDKAATRPEGTKSDLSPR